jgi:hypothetical protein
MSDSYDYAMHKTNCKWDKLATYLYVRALCGWATVGGDDSDWFKVVMEDQYYIESDVWGDTGGGFEHIEVRVFLGKYKEEGNNHGMRYRRKLKLNFAAHTINLHKKFRDYLQQMCDNHNESIEELRDRYFSYDDNTVIEDNYINMVNRGGPLTGKFHELVQEVFNCDLTKVDLSPLWKEYGPIHALSAGAVHEGGVESVARYIDEWRALLVFWVIALHYSMDMSC